MRTIAAKRWPKAIWIEGRGKWASLSACQPGVTVALFSRKADAEAAKHIIDDCGCGGGCMRAHWIVNLERARRVQRRVNPADMRST